MEQPPNMAAQSCGSAKAAVNDLGQLRQLCPTYLSDGKNLRLVFF
jgi:hypothetical protein